VRTRISVVAAGCALLLAAALSASAQDIQERTIRFGHLNNPDHPISAG
jgi:TRAP-type transport system periplasmic protein